MKKTLRFYAAMPFLAISLALIGMAIMLAWVGDKMGDIAYWINSDGYYL